MSGGARSSPAVEQELVQPPADGITRVKWGKSSDSFIASSWDKTVRLYDGRRNEFKSKFEQKAPVLDCCFGADDNHGFSAGLDKQLTMLDFTTGHKTILGGHEAPIKCVDYSEGMGLVLTGGWDSRVNLWDPRAANPTVGSTLCDAKVFTMSIMGHRLVVGTGTRQVLIYDVRQMGHTEQFRESSLMNQTRCIRIFPNGAGYALSSIEGRVAIEFFDTSPEVQKKKYAFKCHRKTDGKIQTLFPVNALAFHPLHGTFATGGCDGMINVWDGENKKRICQYPQYPTSIASMDFNAAGDLLAIASSYTFEEGEKEHPNDQIFIRTVHTNEISSKKLKPTASTTTGAAPTVKR
jgi:cell cycle arrest protein BUB3